MYESGQGVLRSDGDPVTDRLSPRLH
jgi:hypothetical protein